MITRNLLLAFWILFLSFRAISKEEPKWNEGMIFLKSGEVIWGDINYNLSNDLAQCKIGDAIKTFSAYHVDYFRFYDNQLLVNRYFKVVDEKRGQFRKKGFYEIVLDGELPMLRRQKPYAAAAASDFSNYYTDEKDYDYYLLKDDQLISLAWFKKKVVKEIMKDKAEDIADFIEDEQLLTYKLRDQIIIIDYYNSLKDPNYIALSYISN